MTQENNPTPLTKQNENRLGSKTFSGPDQFVSSSDRSPLSKPDNYQKQIQALGEGFLPEAFSWENTAFEAVGANACDWFESLGVLEPNEILNKYGYSEFAIDEKQHMPWLFSEDALPILGNVIVSEEQMGEQIPLVDSQLGEKIIQTIQELGVIWSFTEQEILGVHDEDPSNVVWASVDKKDEGQSQWANGFATNFTQYFRVYRQPNGTEQAFVFFDALVSSRSYSHMNSREVIDPETELVTDWARPIAKHELRLGQIAEFLSIPRFATRAFYLAENPFPSNAGLMTLERSVAYPELSEHLHPEPSILYCHDHPAAGVTNGDAPAGEQQFMFSVFPTVAKMGWRVPDMSVEDLKKCLPIVLDGNVKISTMLEDGYRNFNNSEFVAPFDAVLDSTATFSLSFVPGESSARGYSQWIPGSMIGYRLEETLILKSLALEASQAGDFTEAETALERVACDGVGAFVSDATNTFAFSYLFPQGDFEYAEWLLDAASRLPSGFQAINAKSNLGIALYEMERFEEAEKIFRGLLELPSNPSESEVSYYLARILEDRGDNIASAQFYERCEAAGGYTPFDVEFELDDIEPQDVFEISHAAVTPDSTEAENQIAKFCSQCGTARATDEAKFCANCGKSSSGFNGKSEHMSNQDTIQTFGEFREFVSEIETVVTPFLSGFLNIEGGYLGIASELLPSCRICFGTAADSVFVDCDDCGRSRSNFISLRAGQGDGVYPVYTLAWGQDFLGTISILGPGSDYVAGFSVVLDKVKANEEPVQAFWDFFWNFLSNIDANLRAHYLGTLIADADLTRSSQDNPFSSYYFADATAGSNSQDAVVMVKDIRPGKQDVFIFAQREPENANALVPLVVLTLEQNLAKQIGLPSGHATLDLQQEKSNWNNSQVLSHFGTVNASVAVINAQYFLSLTGKDLWDDLTEFDNYVNCLSWFACYQIVTSGELDDEMKEKFALLPAQSVAQALHIRGYVDLARTFYDYENGEVGPAYREIVERFGSKRNDSAPESILTSEATLVRYCSQCGTTRASAEAKFCANCGSVL